MTKHQIIGTSTPRVEDDAFVRGNGRFLADIKIPGTLAAAFVRSSHAHAAIHGIDVTAAKAAPGVIAVFTMDDLRPYLAHERLQVGMPSKAYLLQIDRPVMADGEVSYVGEPIAVVVAQTRYQAEDAAELVEVDYEPLPALSDCREAMRSDAPRVHKDLPHNLVANFDFDYGNAEQVFESAPHVFHDVFWTHRGGSHSMEGRGVLARLDEVEDMLTLWISTQTPHAAKRLLCDVLGRPDNKLRVITPDIGGGFGPKLVFYQEEPVIALAALLLKQPVQWVEDRREHFISTAHERDQHWDMEIAVDDEGRILGVRGAMLHDFGAYTVRGVNVPYGSGVAVVLPYNVPAYHLDIYVALTNKVPVSSIRGAGQPEGVFVIERLMDLVARQLRLDRDEVRRRNLVTSSQMPCRKPIKMRGGRDVILDSGDYPATQQAVLDLADWQGFKTRQLQMRKQGRYIGLGLANYVEGTGRGPYEGVHIRINPLGRIQVSSGAIAMGQSTKTMLTQIVAEQLGRDFSQIEVVTGDTQNIAVGIGGFNSRQTVMAGSSAHAAAKKLRQRLLDMASDVLGQPEDDLDIVGSEVVSVSQPDVRIQISAIVRKVAGIAGYTLPGSSGPGLEVTEYVVMDDLCFSNGSAAVEVEVDIETGGVIVERFLVAHDCGQVVNPMLVDGQIMGGVAHGIGNALYEWMGYDDNAQPVTTTFGDYLLITASEMPQVDIVHLKSPTPFNELGVKGVGESGVLPTPAAVASAIDDALAPFGVRVSRFPINPSTLCHLIGQAREGQPSMDENPVSWRAEAAAVVSAYRAEPAYA